MSAPGWLEEERRKTQPWPETTSTGDIGLILRLLNLIEQMGEALRIAEDRSGQVFFLTRELERIQAALAAYERGPGQSEPDR